MSVMTYGTITSEEIFSREKCYKALENYVSYLIQNMWVFL